MQPGDVVVGLLHGWNGFASMARLIAFDALTSDENAIAWNGVVWFN